MLTDLHLHKYLQGRLSREDEEELEAILEKNPALKQHLEELRQDERWVTRPTWERMFLDRSARKGSRVRYTTILPAFLILVLILGLTSHWFNKPGRNSTFLHAGGNGTAVELLYNSAQGWRYIDAGFRLGDSLTIAIRDSGRYGARVYAIYAGMPDAVAEEIWAGPEGKFYASGDPKPIFSSRSQANPVPPGFLAVIYDTASLAELIPEELVSLLRDGSGGGRSPSFRYQVFRVPEPGPSSEATTR